MTSFEPSRQSAAGSFSFDEHLVVSQEDSKHNDAIVNIMKQIFKPGAGLDNIDLENIDFEKFDMIKEKINFLDRTVVLIKSKPLRDHIEGLTDDLKRYLSSWDSKDKGSTLGTFGSTEIDQAILKRLGLLEQVKVKKTEENEKERQAKIAERSAYVQNMDCYTDMIGLMCAKELLEKQPIGSYIIFREPELSIGTYSISGQPELYQEDTLEPYFIAYRDQSGRTQHYLFKCEPDEYSVSPRHIVNFTDKFQSGDISDIDPIVTLKHRLGPENLTNPITFNFEAIKKKYDCFENYKYNASDVFKIRKIAGESPGKTLIWSFKTPSGKEGMMAFSTNDYGRNMTYLTGAEENLETLFGDYRPLLNPARTPEAPPAPFPKTKGA